MSLPKLKNWYHATTYDHAEKILECGYLIPQEHKTGSSLGVFFSNSKENAGYFLSLRGHSKYIVFKVPRSRLNSKLIHESDAHKTLPGSNMICIRYLEQVPVGGKDILPITDERCWNIPGTEVITNGTNRTAIKIVDQQAFEQARLGYIKSNPEIEAIFEKGAVA